MEMSQTTLDEGAGATITVSYNEGEVVIGNGIAVQGGIGFTSVTTGIMNTSKINKISTLIIINR